MRRSYKSQIPKSERTHRDAIVARKLMASPILGDTYCIRSEPGAGNQRIISLCIGYPEQNYLEGGMYEHSGLLSAAYITRFAISSNLRGIGLGRRMLKAFVAEVKSLGAEELWSDEVSNDALRLRARIFGASALTFYDSDFPDSEAKLPLTFEQALACNDRVEETWKNLTPNKDPQSHLGVYVDLRPVDTTGWEMADFTQLESAVV